MPILNVFNRNISDAIEHDPSEVCKIPDGYSFNQYLTEFVPAYNQDCDLLFSFHVDGEHWPTARWGEVLPQDATCEAVRAPQGAEVVIPLVIAAISAAWTIYQMSKLEVPDTYNQTAPQSSSIYGANAQANSVRLMSPATELFGRHLIVPDYLSAPFREYIAHEEWLYLFLRVSVGDCEIDLSEILIGDTALNTLGSDVEFSVHAPGASVAEVKAAQHWYSVDEVSGSGIELKGTIPDFEFITPYVVGEATYVWEVQADPTKLIMYQYFVSTEDSLINQGAFNWKSWFNDAGYADTALVGVILKIWTGTEYNYYRCIDDASTATFAKVDPVTYEIDQTWTGFGSTGDLISAYYQTRPEAGEWGSYAGWFNTCPSGKTTDKIKLNFSLPEGLCKLDNKNIPREHSITVTVEYRATEAGTVYTTDYIFTESTLDGRGYTRIIEGLAAAGWQVRINVSSITHNSNATKERLLWTSLQSSLPTLSSYAEFTTLAVAIKGTQRLSQSASDKVRVIGTRKLPLIQYSGGVYSLSAPVATRNPVPAAIYISTQAQNPLSRIDLAEMYRLQQIFETRQDYFDGIFDQSTTTWEAMKRVLAVGRTEPIVDGGKVVPVRDEMRTDPAWFFSEDCTLGDFEFSASMATSGGTDEYDGIELEYYNPETWKPDTKLCLLPDQSGINPRRVRAYGVTDVDHAYRYGMTMLARERYRNILINFQASLEGTRVSYLDSAELGWTMVGQSQTGIVLGKSGLTLTLSEPLRWIDGEAHIIKIRTREGKVSDPFTVTKGPNENQVVLASDLNFEIVLTGREEPPIFMFGIASEISMRTLVKKSALSGTARAKITLMLDDPLAYQYDDAVAPS